MLLSSVDIRVGSALRACRTRQAAVAERDLLPTAPQGPAAGRASRPSAVRDAHTCAPALGGLRDARRGPGPALDDEHVRVHGKEAPSAPSFWMTAATALLKLYLARSGYSSGPLFRASINGHGGPLSYDAAHSRWEKHCAVAGGRDWHPPAPPCPRQFYSAGLEHCSLPVSTAASPLRS